MHSKFVLVENEGESFVIFGSFNWNDQSRFLNREIAVSIRDAALFDAFADRWEVLRKSAT